MIALIIMTDYTDEADFVDEQTTNCDQNSMTITPKWHCIYSMKVFSFGWIFYLIDLIKHRPDFINIAAPSKITFFPSSSDIIQDSSGFLFCESSLEAFEWQFCDQLCWYLITKSGTRRTKLTSSRCPPGRMVYCFWGQWRLVLEVLGSRCKQGIDSVCVGGSNVSSNAGADVPLQRTFSSAVLKTQLIEYVRFRRTCSIVMSPQIRILDIKLLIWVSSVEFEQIYCLCQQSCNGFFFIQDRILDTYFSGSF